MNKIVLIDGHSILNRAFFGIPDLTNSEGIHTNAVYGFLNIMFMILEEEKAEYITVAFDEHAPTFRHELFPEYKGTRSPMAEELKQQVPIIKEVLKAMNIQVCSMAGYEADDILGTIAKKCQAEGFEVSLVSGDRDLLQISDEHIKIRIPKTKGGKTQIENYYPQDVVDNYGVSPQVFIDMKALMGDSSDNIHGVSGVGPKSAEKLLKAYGSLDGIYEHIDELKKSAMKDNLINEKESAYFAKKLVTILTDAPISFDIELAKIDNMYTPEAYALFKKLEFKVFLSRFNTQSASFEDIENHFHVIDDLAKADSLFNGLLKEAGKATDDAFDIAINIIGNINNYDQSDIYALTIANNSEDINTIICENFITSGYLISMLNKLAVNDNVRFIVNGAKKIYPYFACDFIEDKCFDVNIAAYLLDPLRGEYDSEYIASLYNNQMIPGRDQLIDKKLTVEECFSANPEAAIKFSSYIVYAALTAYPVMLKKLSESGMLELFYRIEMPLTGVLSSMERTGVMVKPDMLTDFSSYLGQKMEELSADIYSLAGEEFNILSPKQLGTILFEKMGYPGGKKTKTGYSTASDVLEKLKDKPLVADILEYRAVSKLKSTYADGLMPYIDDQNRIHSTFHQTITATGRISSADPNLQNIPTRTELGKQLRAAFVPMDGYVFADADYSQIELRILAHIADDKELLTAYREGRDIHSITASKVFNVPLDEVTPLLRRNAKAVNFGIVYGISSFGLSQDLDISKKEAAEYIEQYFETFPGIKKYLDESVQKAIEDGFVTTLYGRIRPIPELSSSNFMQRQFGERVAMNSPIQGTAADIMKLAMIGVYRRIKKANLKSRIVLQIHDELLIETALDEQDTIKTILEEEMSKAAELNVNLEIDMHFGKDWLDAK